MSAIFFGGPPLRVFRGWRAGAFKMVISPAILAEYRRVADELSNEYTGVDAKPILNVLGLGLGFGIGVKGPPRPRQRHALAVLGGRRGEDLEDKRAPEDKEDKEDAPQRFSEGLED